MDFRLDDEQLALQDSDRAPSARTATRSTTIGQHETPARSTATEPLAGAGELGVFSIMVPEADGRRRVRHGRSRAGLRAARSSTRRRVRCCGRPWPRPCSPDAGRPGDRSCRATTPPRRPTIRSSSSTRRTSTRCWSCAPTGVVVVDRSELDRTRDRSIPLDPLTPVGRFRRLPAGTAVGGVDELADGCGRWARCWPPRCWSASPTRALDVARDYALEREQFGVPIGSFQAVKHLLADMYVRTGLARSATYAAAAVLDDPAVGDARPVGQRGQAAGRRGGDRQRPGRRADPRRDGLHLGDAPELPAQAGLGAREQRSARPIARASRSLPTWRGRLAGPRPPQHQRREAGSTMTSRRSATRSTIASPRSRSTGPTSSTRSARR